MSQNIPLAKNDIAIEPFFDTVQEMLSGASPYFSISVVSATPVVTLRLAAGTGSTQQSISIEGFYRYRTAQIDATHPAGAAGSYDVYVTTGNNDFTGPSPNIDLTNYAFGFEIRASGSLPTTAHYRKVGETQWSGSAITGFRQLVGHRRDDSMVTPTANHATMTPLRTIGAASQSAALATFESNTNAIKASIAADGTINTVTGYQVSGTALAASHLSNGTTGTGAVVLAGGTPNFTGAATGQTAAPDTNTTQLATTAYVVGNGYLKSATAATTYQPLDGDLTSLAALATTGSVHRTAANTMTVRTLTGTAGQITITNGDGVSGNPTVSLPTTITQATAFSAGSAIAGTLVPASGVNLELGTTGGTTGFIQAFNRTASSAVPLNLGGSAVNTFIGSTQILGVNAAGKTALTLSDTGAQNTGFTIGGDTNFYRSAAATLKTDHALHVALAFRHLGTTLGFYNAAAVSQQTRPTTLNEVIAVLVNLGLTA